MHGRYAQGSYGELKMITPLEFDPPLRTIKREGVSKLYLKTQIQDWNSKDLREVSTKIISPTLKNELKKSYEIQSTFGAMVDFVLEDHERIRKKLRERHENNIILDETIFS